MVIRLFFRTVGFFMLLLVSCNEEELPSESQNNEISLAAARGTNFVIENSDPFKLLKVEVVEEQVEVTVQYAGGCKQHNFEMVWPEIMTDVFPPDFEVVLNHDSNDDMCEALITRILSFGISDSGHGFSSQEIESMRITVVNGSNEAEKVSNR